MENQSPRRRFSSINTEPAIEPCSVCLHPVPTKDSGGPIYTSRSGFPLCHPQKTQGKHNLRPYSRKKLKSQKKRRPIQRASLCSGGRSSLSCSLGSSSHVNSNVLRLPARAPRDQSTTPNMPALSIPDHTTGAEAKLCPRVESSHLLLVSQTCL